MSESLKDIWIANSDAEGLGAYVRVQWPQLADALDRETQLVTGNISPGEYKYERHAVFARYPKDSGGWHILGPEDIIVPGAVVEVFKHADNGHVYVTILNIVASRMVARRDGTYVMYVMATFDHVEGED